MAPRIPPKPEGDTNILGLLGDKLFGMLFDLVTGAAANLVGILGQAAQLINLRWLQADATEAKANDAFDAANTAIGAVTDLSAIVAASKATAAYTGNTNDMVSVPRWGLIPQPGTTSGSTSLGSHNHSMGSGSNTGSTSLGSHSHPLSKSIPKFSPSAPTSLVGTQAGTIYYTPIISDREGDLDKFRFITGADDSLFGIDHYHVALMIYNVAAGKFQTIWNPGNIKDNMGSSLSEVSISMGLTGAAAKVAPLQILVAAHQQTAPGLAQSSRSVAWVPQAGIARTTDVLLRGCYYRTSGDVAAGIPSEATVSSLVPMNDGIPWYAVSVNNT